MIRAKLITNETVAYGYFSCTVQWNEEPRSNPETNETGLRLY